MASLRGSKFEPLTNFLCNTDNDVVTLTFSQIEEILHSRLCESARKYIAYWHPSKTHKLPLAWEEAGFELSDLDINLEEVTLHKKR